MAKVKTLFLASIAASSLVMAFGATASHATPKPDAAQDNTSTSAVSSAEAQIYIPEDVAKKMAANGVPASKQHSPEYAEMVLDEYWTPERMENAIPVDMDASRDAAEISPESPPAPPEEKKPPLNAEAPAVSLSDPVGPSDPSPDIEEPSPDTAGRSANQTENVITSGLITAAVTPTTTYAPANGKVFFRKVTDGKDYICSGAAVNSTSRNLVSTAAHCVQGGPGGDWHQNWAFAPAVKYGVNTYGLFTARSFHSLPGWAQYGSSGAGFDQDQAFVVTNNQASGKSLVDRVGGHGLRTSGPLSFPTNIFGYPANLSSGIIQQSCWGTTNSYTYDSHDFTQAVGCNFGGGASGGPWLVDYNSSNGLGYIRTVSSFGPGSPAFIAGPNFDSRTSALYAVANATGL